MRVWLGYGGCNPRRLPATRDPQLESSPFPGEDSVRLARAWDDKLARPAYASLPLKGGEMEWGSAAFERSKDVAQRGVQH